MWQRRHSGGAALRVPAEALLSVARGRECTAPRSTIILALKSDLTVLRSLMWQRRHSGGTAVRIPT